MPFEDFVVCDADMHVMEPADLWQRYMTPEYRHAAPIGMTELKRDIRVKVKSQILLRAGPVRPLKERGGSGIGWRPDQEAAYGEAEARGWDAQAQLDAMDREGVDLTVLFPTRGLFALGLDSTEQIGADGLEPSFATAIARAYNDWLHHFCSYDPARLKLNALVPIVDNVEGAVDEIRRVVTELGAVSIQPGSTRADCRLDDPAYEPVWAEAERLNVPLTFHGTAQLHLSQRYARDPLHGHASGRGIEHPVAFMELLYGGVLERHPGLRVAFLEAGASWIMYWLFRLEEECEKSVEFTPGLDERVRLRAIEYWQRQCFTSVEVDEWPLRHVIDMVGDDTLMVSSDFPHHDCAFPEAFTRFMAIPGVSDESRSRILWDNTARLYNLA